MMQKDNLHIRDMTVEDIPEIVRLENECFSHPWSEKMIEDELNNTFSKLYVAQKGGRVIGYAGVQLICDQAYITNIAVENASRRLGVGKELLKTLILSARDSDMEFITLEVRKGNLSAIALYESMGFNTEGIRAGYYQNPVEDAVLMTLWFKE